MHLRVEAVHEGLVLQWNRTHPSFVVKPGDLIVRVNERYNNAGTLVEELSGHGDTTRLTVRRAEHQRIQSRPTVFGGQPRRLSLKEGEGENTEGQGIKLPSPKAGAMRQGSRKT